MVAALAILAKQRGDVTFVHQSMYYPVTDAAQDPDSHREFADGPFMMLNPVRESAATTAAIEQAIHILRKTLGTDDRAFPMAPSTGVVQEPRGNS